jgi:hypothetical protein
MAFSACVSSLYGKSRFLCAARFGMTRAFNFMNDEKIAKKKPHSLKWGF